MTKTLIKKYQVNFLCYEMLAAFFLLTYEDAADLLGHVITPTHQFDNALLEIVPWVWLLFMFLFLGLGIYELWSNNNR